MQVEEDPSSQFVDFTNATALEQFISDAEQTLIAWHLSGKGHASAEALAATHGEDAGAVSYTRVLEFEQPPRKPDGSVASASASTLKVKYALTLFVSRAPAAAPRGGDTGAKAVTNGTKQWQQGREHFTPTMLAIADARRDVVAGAKDEDDGDSSGVTAAAIARNAERWFGVDEFLMVTKTSLPSERERRLQQLQQQQAVMRRQSRNSSNVDLRLVEEAQAAAAGGGGDGQRTAASAAFDGSMDANEANLLLSAIHLALLNCNCTIPVFVPVQSVAKGTWLGSAVPGSTGNVSIHFETDSIPEVNSNQSCISGLLDFFQLKLQLPPHVEDMCRLADGGDAAELSVGTWVSAAFRYAWLRDDDPREAERQPMEWRFAGVDQTADTKHLSRVLFGAPPTTNGHYWGAATNPIAGIELTAIWPSLREGTYVDNAVHSTLDPQTAPEWMVDVAFDKKSGDWTRGLHDLSRKPTMPLSRVIANLVQAYSNVREINRDVLVSELAPTIHSPPAPGSSAMSAFASPPTSTSSESYAAPSRLPGTIPAARAAAVFGNAIGSITSSIVSAATWKGADVEEIRRVVAELFDEKESSPAANAERTLSDKWSAPSAVAHAAPVGELVSVLACRMGQLHGVSAMSLLWVEFVKSLRERWFQQQLLPLMSTNDTSSGEKYDEVTARALDALFLLESASVNLPNPDFHQCLLHQKLQLLNSCILRQAESRKSGNDSEVIDSSLRRSLTGMSQNAVGTRMSDLTAFQFEDDAEDGDGSPSDDEFFDSIELHETSTPAPAKAALAPAGVKRAVSGMVCLLTGVQMMEPITQAAVPLTEDVAKQQQELLSRLGVGSESTMLRQRLQSAALVSDMQAFKAANPGSCLVDFIRWYSPKDWIAADPLTASSIFGSLPVEGKNVWWFEGQGMLSERMRSSAGTSPSSSQHLWHHMWETSAPLPVSKQKCLFDPVGESEKLYHYLETISPHEMFHQMLVGAISSCYTMLSRSLVSLRSRSCIPTVEAALDELRKQCDRTVARLDEAFAESQIAFPPGRDQKGELEKAKSQLQVAFEMALDACRTMARTFEEVELMLSQTTALLQYFSSGDAAEKSTVSADCVKLVDLLLATAYKHVPSDGVVTARRSISALLHDEALRSRLASLVLHNPASRDPVHREYVIRCICPRPYLDDYQCSPECESDDEEDGAADQKRRNGDHDESAILDLLEDSPVVVNRMYASFTNHTVRFALTLAESEF